MIPLNDLILFSAAAIIMVLTPGPNMIYLLSRSMSQGKKAGFISLIGVVCGFLFHIIMVSFGLTAVFFAIPYAFIVVKSFGVCYLLYLAYKAVAGGSVFAGVKRMETDDSLKLFSMGFLTNVLNPKMALFYISFFPQFIKPENGPVLVQSFQLGLLHIVISFIINLVIVLSASKLTGWFSQNSLWIRIQKWIVASVLTSLAVKMAFTKIK